MDLMFSNLALYLTEAIDPLIKCDEHHIPVVCTYEANTVETVNEVDDNVSNFYKVLDETIKDNVLLMLIKACHFPP